MRWWLGPVSHLPEGDVAVSVGVGGQVATVRGERHRCDGPFVSVDVLVEKRESPLNPSSFVAVVDQSRPEERLKFPQFNIGPES